MQTFEIKEQVKLPLRRCMELVIDGIRFCLLRSVISVAIVGLAVAFMTTVLSKSLIERQITSFVDNSTYPRRLLLFWINRLTTPVTEYEIARILADVSPSDARLKEFIKWGECTDVELRQLMDVAKSEGKYLRFFNELSEGKRRAIVGQAEGYQMFHQLLKSEVFEKFESELSNIGKKFPGSVSEFREFLTSWHTTFPLREKIKNGHAKAVAMTIEIIGARPVQEAIASFDKGAKHQLESANFYISDDELEIIIQEVRKNIKFKKVAEWFENTTFRNQFAAKYGFKDIKRLTPDVIFAYASAGSGTERVMKILQEAGIKVDVDITELRSIAKQYVKYKRLAEIESNADVFRQEQGFMGFSNRVLWLILVSVLVCIVGVTNAMLMSVTERFKEIATMKCFGATDSFIMIHFMIESSLLGVVGGIAGAVLGLILGMFAASTYYGTFVLHNLSLFSLIGAALVSIAGGTLISIIAAVYPARVAARLAPMEAMRVE